MLHSYVFAFFCFGIFAYTASSWIEFKWEKPSVSGIILRVGNVLKKIPLLIKPGRQKPKSTPAITNNPNIIQRSKSRQMIGQGSNRLSEIYPNNKVKPKELRGHTWEVKYLWHEVLQVRLDSWQPKRIFTAVYLSQNLSLVTHLSIRYYWSAFLIAALLAYRSLLPFCVSHVWMSEMERTEWISSGGSEAVWISQTPKSVSVFSPPRWKRMICRTSFYAFCEIPILAVRTRHCLYAFYILIIFTNNETMIAKWFLW